MNQSDTLFTVVHENQWEDTFNQVPQSSSLPQSCTKEKSSGVQNSLKRFYIQRNRSRFPFKHQNYCCQFKLFLSFLTSSYQQTAIQAFGGHQNVHFHSEVRLIANVEDGRVGRSSVFIRCHSCTNILNRNGWRCTKHPAGSRLAAFLSGFFFHPGLLIRSRLTVFTIGWLMAGDRRGKGKQESAQRIWSREKGKMYGFNSSRASRVLNKNISYPWFVFCHLHAFRFPRKIYP